MMKMDKFKEIQNLNLSYGDDSENKNVKAKDNVLETPFILRKILIILIIKKHFLV